MHTIITFLVLILAVGTSAQTECPAGTGVCNGTTYEKALFHCAYDQTRGQYMICPSDFQACNGACFNSTSYNCVQGTLAAISPPPATSASTTSAAPQPTAAATCPTWLKACGQACYADGDYCCTNDLLQPGPCDDDSDFCPSWLQRCGDACYLATEYCCQNDLLSSGACGGATQQPKPSTTSKSTSSTTKATTSTTKQATPTTSAPVVVNPTPSPNNFPTQTADLRIINNCKDTLWFEGRYGGSGGPIPGQSSTVTRALPGSYVDYTVPSTGLPGTRFWAKYGCDSNGRNCLIGDQMQYWPNPPGGCPAAGCSPPVDSLFEATWGCKPGSNCANTNPTTWFDTSQVDGWTIPYKLTPVGDTSKCDCSGSNCGFKGVDASTLDLAKCPTGDDLSNNGQFPSVTSNGKTTNLRSVDLRIIDSQKRVIGCMSPCKKLNWSAPYGLGQSESSGSALWMCCPTPNPANCNPANGCVLPDACRAGPIEKTQYVSAVHTMAPGVYSFSYDDGVGLHACPAGIVKYTMEFCPKGASSYPLQL